jgi:single-strand DNA-binding protein
VAPRVIFSEGLAKVAEQYLTKGARIYVEGQLQTRKWQDQQGQDRYSTEVVLQGFNCQLIMLDKANGGADGSYGGDNRPGAPAPARQSATAGGIPHDDMNDEVPF